MDLALQQAEQQWPDQARNGGLHDEATQLLRHLTGLSAAISSCLPRAPPAPHGDPRGSLPGSQASPLPQKDLGTQWIGMIAAAESLRDAGDWAGVLSLVETRLIDQLSGDTRHPFLTFYPSQKFLVIDNFCFFFLFLFFFGVFPKDTKSGYR